MVYQKEEHILPFLIPGRLIKIQDSTNHIDYGWGIVVNFTRKVINIKGAKKTEQDGKSQIIIDVLLYLDKKVNHRNHVQPSDIKKKEGMLGVVPVTLTTVEALSKVQMKIVFDMKDKSSV